MKNFENANIFKKIGIKPHQIVVAITSIPDYEMDRQILLTEIDGLNYGEYLLLDGGHCSCYDFDETSWQGTIYTKEELLKIGKSEYNTNNVFWKEVLKQI